MHEVVEEVLDSIVGRRVVVTLKFEVKEGGVTLNKFLVRLVCRQFGDNRLSGPSFSVVFSAQHIALLSGFDLGGILARTLKRG